MKQEHKYAQVLRWVADGERVQVQGGNEGWITLEPSDVLVGVANSVHIDRFRLAPRTMMVNGREVPEPVKVPPRAGVPYIVACIEAPGFYRKHIWANLAFDSLLLRRGLIHPTKESAIAHAKAMLGVDE